jgi:chemotaxis protein histidine kinase CheA
VPTTSAPARGGRGGARGRGRGRGRGNQDRSNQDRNNPDRNNQDHSKQDHNNQDRTNQNRSDQGRRNQARSNSDLNNNDPRRNNNESGHKNNEPRQNNTESRRNNQDRTKKEPQPKHVSKDASKDTPKEITNEQQEQQEQQSSATATATTAAAEPSKPATNAVRGDRTATGGLRKPKLSEQELAEKMSRISLKNEKLAAAHARAEADAADFAEREEIAAKRRQEERRDRQQMMGEREKNRLRKLKAVGGREWDAEKPDDADAFGGPRQAGGRGRGAHGGIAGQRNQDGSREGFSGDKEDYTDGREYMYREDRGRGRGRGRGGRGGATGRGGRGPQQEKSSSQSIPKPTDFPEISGSASAPKFDTAPPPTMAFPTQAKVEKFDIDDQLTPGTEKKSWADMME